MSQDTSFDLAAAGHRVRMLDAKIDTQTPQTATIAYVKDALGAVKQVLLETHDAAQEAELKDIEAQLLALYKRLVAPTAAKQQLQPIDASGDVGLQKGLEQPEFTMYRENGEYVFEQRELDERGCGCTRKPTKALEEHEPEISVDALGYMHRGD